MARTQRISLSRHIDDIRRWVHEGRGDEWIANALGTSATSIQSFRSRRGIYRQEVGFAPPTPEHYSAFEGAVEDGRAVWFDPEVAADEAYRRGWAHAEKARIHVTPSRIVISR